MSTQPITVHVTDVLAYKACRRAWHWGSRYRTALEPRKPHGPFFIGKAVHYVIEQLRSEGVSTTDALAQFLQAEVPRYAFVQEPSVDPSTQYAVTGTRLKYRHPDWDTVGPEIRGYVRMIKALIRAYLSFSRQTKSPFADSQLETLAHEMKFGEDGELPAVPLKIKGEILQPIVYLAGTLDGMERVRQNGSVWISEYKTCRDIDERAKLLQHDEQATCYVYAAGELFGRPVSGVIYTLLRKKIPGRPTILKNGLLSVAKSLDTTYDMYLAEIRRHHGEDVGQDFIKRHYGEMLQYLRDFGEPYVARVAITRPQEQVDNYIRELHQTALEMHDPRTPLYANRTFSCPGCHFRQPCLALDRAEYDRMHTLLHTTYRTRTAEAIPSIEVRR